MPPSKRQQVLAAVDAGLKTILTDAGYATNLGAHVYEWREEQMQEGDIPGAIWRDTDEVVAETFGQETHTLTVSIELFAMGADAPAHLRSMMADVVKMIGLDLTWGGLAEDTQPEQESIHTERENKRIAVATVKFQILFVTGRFNPYV